MGRCRVFPGQPLRRETKLHQVRLKGSQAFKFFPPWLFHTRIIYAMLFVARHRLGGYWLLWQLLFFFFFNCQCLLLDFIAADLACVTLR